MLVDADVDDDYLMGKSLSDLQDDIVIDEDGNISGALHYIDGYTGFSDDPELQSGYFLALHFDPENPIAYIVTDLIGKTCEGDMVAYDTEAIDDERSQLLLDSDGEIIEGTKLKDIYVVFRITDKSSQAIRAVASNGYREIVMTYNLDGLVLEERP